MSKKQSSQEKSKETSKKKKEKVKKYADNKKSYITIIKNQLLVMNSKYPDLALTAIKVCKGAYLELGRPLSDFNKVLEESRIPLAFVFVIKMDNVEHYKMIRMKTGKVDDFTLGGVVCKDGIITSINCAKNYLNEGEYENYDEVGLLWKVRVQHTDDIEQNKKLISNTVAALCKFNLLTNASLKINYGTSDTNVVVKSNELNYTYSFVLNNETDMFELVTISMNRVKSNGTYESRL